MASKQEKPKCPICGGSMRFRWKTQDFACLSGPHLIPLAQMTPASKPEAAHD